MEKVERKGAERAARAEGARLSTLPAFEQPTSEAAAATTSARTNTVQPPTWPPPRLDGELRRDREQFERCVGIIKYHTPAPPAPPAPALPSGLDIWDPVWEPARSHSWHKQSGQTVPLNWAR